MLRKFPKTINSRSDWNFRPSPAHSPTINSPKACLKLINFNIASPKHLSSDTAYNSDSLEVVVQNRQSFNAPSTTHYDSFFHDKPHNFLPPHAPKNKITKFATTEQPKRLPLQWFLYREECVSTLDYTPTAILNSGMVKLKYSATQKKTSYKRPKSSGLASAPRLEHLLRSLKGRRWRWWMKEEEVDGWCGLFFVNRLNAESRTYKLSPITILKEMGSLIPSNRCKTPTGWCWVNLVDMKCKDDDETTLDGVSGTYSKRLELPYYQFLGAYVEWLEKVLSRSLQDIDDMNSPYQRIG